MSADAEALLREVVEGERLTDDTGEETDRAYNRALDDVLAALERRLDPTGRSVRAIDLAAQHLWHWVTATDYTGQRHRGVLHTVTLSPRNRVNVRVAVQMPTGGGGAYWSMSGDTRYLDHDSLVEIGELLPEAERWS